MSVALLEHIVCRTRQARPVIGTLPVSVIMIAGNLLRTSMSSSPIGSLAVQGPSLTPQVVTVNASTCTNLSLFKGNELNTSVSTHKLNTRLHPDLLKEYRALDDSITMRFVYLYQALFVTPARTQSDMGLRFNRATAAMRDKDRESSAGNRPPPSTVQDQACLYIWRDLMCSLVSFHS